METVSLYAGLARVAALLFCVVYGVAVSFRKKGILFVQIVTCAFGCMALGEVFAYLQRLITGAPPVGFHVGLLGMIGGYFFFCRQASARSTGWGTTAAGSCVNSG